MGSPGGIVLPLAGISSIFQGILSATFAVFGISVHQCFLEFPLPVNAKNRANYVLYLAYFKGKCDLHPGGSKAEWAGEAESAARTFYLLLIYGGVNAIWVLTSALLLIVGIQRPKNCSTKGFSLAWITNTILVILADLTGGIWYGIDIARTLTSSDVRNFVDWEAGPLPVELDDVSYVAAVVMSSISLRGVVVFVVNVVLLVLVARAVIALTAESGYLNACEDVKIRFGGKTLHSLYLSDNLSYRKYSLNLAKDWDFMNSPKTHTGGSPVSNGTQIWNPHVSPIVPMCHQNATLSSFLTPTVANGNDPSQTSQSGPPSDTTIHLDLPPAQADQQPKYATWDRANLVLQDHLRQQSLSRLEAASRQQLSCFRDRPGTFKMSGARQTSDKSAGGSAPVSRRPSAYDLIALTSPEIAKNGQPDSRDADKVRSKRELLTFNDVIAREDSVLQHGFSSETMNCNSNDDTTRCIRTSNRSNSMISNSDQSYIEQNLMPLPAEKSYIKEQDRRLGQAWVWVNGSLRPYDYYKNRQQPEVWKGQKIKRELVNDPEEAWYQRSERILCSSPGTLLPTVAIEPFSVDSLRDPDNSDVQQHQRINPEIPHTESYNNHSSSSQMNQQDSIGLIHDESNAAVTQQIPCIKGGANEKQNYRQPNYGNVMEELVAQLKKRNSDGNSGHRASRKRAHSTPKVGSSLKQEAICELNDKPRRDKPTQSRESTSTRRNHTPKKNVIKQPRASDLGTPQSGTTLPDHTPMSDYMTPKVGHSLNQEVVLGPTDKPKRDRQAQSTSNLRNHTLKKNLIKQLRAPELGTLQPGTSSLDRTPMSEYTTPARFPPNWPTEDIFRSTTNSAPTSNGARRISGVAPLTPILSTSSGSSYTTASNSTAEIGSPASSSTHPTQ